MEARRPRARSSTEQELPCYGTGMGKGTARRGRPALPVSAGLGQRIREARIALGLTQAGLGAPLYASGYISNVEHGRVTPSLEALGYLAERLGLTVAELIGADTPPLRVVDALGRAQRLLTDAQAGATPQERELLTAASLMLGALRRHLTGR